MFSRRISQQLQSRKSGFFSNVFVVTRNRYDFNGLTWEIYCREIDANRPVTLFVDSNGDGVTDHFVLGIGYDDEGAHRYYACYNTWNTNIHWYEWNKVEAGKKWGVDGGTYYFLTYKPNKPLILSGPGSGKINVLLNFSARATDPDGDPIKYTFTSPLNENGEWLTKEGDAGEYEVILTAIDGTKLLNIMKTIIPMKMNATTTAI